MEAPAVGGDGAALRPVDRARRSALRRRRGGEATPPEARPRRAVPRPDAVLGRHRDRVPRQDGRRVDVQAEPIARVELVAPAQPPIVERQLHDRAGPRVRARHGQVRRARPGEDGAPGRVHRHGAQHPAAVSALRDHGGAPSPRAVGEAVRGDAAPGVGRLAAGAGPRDHQPRGDDRRTPEVVVAARLPQRLGLPEQGPVAQPQAAEAVRRHDHATAVHGAPAEEAERHRALARSVDRGIEAAPPALAPVGEVEHRDLAAEGRRDHAPADHGRRARHPAGDGAAPAHRQARRRPRSGARGREVVRRLGPRVAHRRPARGGRAGRGPLGEQRRGDHGRGRQLQELVASHGPPQMSGSGPGDASGGRPAPGAPRPADRPEARRPPGRERRRCRDRRATRAPARGSRVRVTASPERTMRGRAPPPGTRAFARRTAIRSPFGSGPGRDR